MINDKHGGDSLSDFGFSLMVGLIIIAFAAVMYWVVPPLARWVALP